MLHLWAESNGASLPAGTARPPEPSVGGSVGGRPALRSRPACPDSFFGACRLSGVRCFAFRPDPGRELCRPTLLIDAAWNKVVSVTGSLSCQVDQLIDQLFDSEFDFDELPGVFDISFVLVYDREATDPVISFPAPELLLQFIG